jgi:ABC-type multidrug transport system ATPase subunit
MGNKKRLIYQVSKLEQYYGSYKALKISKLEIHPGTIYAVIGTVGSGKSTLLNILSGVEKQSSGDVLYDEEPFERNWLGKIVENDQVFYASNPKLQTSNKRVSSYVSNSFGKKKNVIQNRYFNEGSFKNLWDRKIKDISKGELHWLGMILACEADPRVLLIDDYGMYFNGNMERDFRNQITKMNRNLGTTIVLSAPSDVNVKHFASVLIYLDHGHISKIRTGSGKPRRNNDRQKRGGYGKNRSSKRPNTNRK